MEKVKTDVGGIKTDISNLTATFKKDVADAARVRAEERNTGRTERAREQQQAEERSAAALKDVQITIMNAIAQHAGSSSTVLESTLPTTVPLEVQICPPAAPL
jgi:regulator of protease activity HflC (stomatin/prohibitin superfamily)